MTASEPDGSQAHCAPDGRAAQQAGAPTGSVNAGLGNQLSGTPSQYYNLDPNAPGFGVFTPQFFGQQQPQISDLQNPQGLGIFSPDYFAQLQNQPGGQAVSGIGQQVADQSNINGLEGTPQGGGTGGAGALGELCTRIGGLPLRP